MTKKTIIVAAVLLLAAVLFVGAGAAEGDNVAKIGSDKYATLAAAVAAVPDSSETTITLLNDVVLDKMIIIERDKIIKLDLAGKSITPKTDGLAEQQREDTGPTAKNKDALFGIMYGGKLTIEDTSAGKTGKISSNNEATVYAAVKLTLKGDNGSDSPSILIVNGGTLEGTYYAICGNGSPGRANTQITINGGIIKGTLANNNLGIYHPQEGTLTVNGGTITGYGSAIEMRAGTLTITDGTFEATATEYDCSAASSGATTVGAAIAIAQHTTKKPIAVTINGGVFNGVKALNEANPQGNDFTTSNLINVKVTGGEFRGDVQFTDVESFGSSEVGDATTPIEGGSFTSDVISQGYVPDDKKENINLIKNGDSEVKYEGDLEYTIIIPTTFDFGNNLKLQSKVAVNFLVAVPTKKVQIAVAAENTEVDGKHVLMNGPSSVKYIMGLNANYEEDDAWSLDFNSPGVPDVMDETIYFKLLSKPTVGGIYTDTLTFTSSVGTATTE